MKKFSLLMSIFISILPLVILSLFFFKQLKSVTESQVQQTIQREVEIGSQNLNDFFDERRGNLLEWAKSPSVHIAFEFKRPEGLTINLEYLKNQYPVYDWIGVLNKNNSIFSITDGNNIEIKSLLSDINESTNKKFLILNNDLYFFQKIYESNTNHYLGHLVAKINRNKFLNFSNQIYDHLDRFKFRSIKVYYNEVKSNSKEQIRTLESANDEYMQLCPSGKSGFEVSICISLLKSDLSHNLNQLQWLVVIVTIILITITFGILNRTFQRFVDPFSKILNALTDVTLGIFNKIHFNSKLKEINLIEEQFNNIIEKLREASLKLTEHARHEALYEVSMQVAHDIRSPLAALEMITKQLDEVPDPKRVLIKNSVQRISDIANDLLIKSKSSNGTNIVNSDNKQSKDCLLEAEISSVLSEKRIQFREKQGIEIISILNNNYGIFVKIDTKEFKRVISNLINNSVENLEIRNQNQNLFDGQIKVSLELKNDIMATITIRDNGMGMPSELISQLGSKGVTQGKENSTSGSGLGIYHAKKTIESFGGTFIIDSSIGVGTSIIISIPRSPAPNWFLEKLILKHQQKIIILDDDIAIHGLWQQRILKLNQDLLSVDKYINVLGFTSAFQFKQWFQVERESIKNIQFLIDYELLNQSQNGLEIIEELGIQNQSILVTSHYEDQNIIEQCLKLKIKQIPKGLAANITISIKEEEDPLFKPDAVVLDDDPLQKMVWELFANEKNKQITFFQNSSQLFEQLHLFNLTTVFYIDVNLGNGIKGEDIALQLYQMGFNQIYLSTGDEASNYEKLPFIKGVCGKGPQF